MQLYKVFCFIIIFLYIFEFDFLKYFFKVIVLFICFGCRRPSLWCMGFTLQWLVLLPSLGLGMWASVVAARGFRSWGAWAWLLPGMWNLPRPGIEPMSPALAGEFLTTGPRGKSLSNTLNHL